METVFIETKDGTFTAHFSNQGLARLEFPTEKDSIPVPKTSIHREGWETEWLHLLEVALQNVLSGRPAGEMPPLDLAKGTEFQQSVWKLLVAIPFGKTMTYTEVAEAIGRRGAVRAVGQACGANPIPVLIPCHRVIAARGRLGGFSGGLNWKVRLLQREGFSNFQPELFIVSL